jgi:hypothetical protein
MWASKCRDEHSSHNISDLFLSLPCYVEQLATKLENAFFHELNQVRAQSALTQSFVCLLQPCTLWTPSRPVCKL